MNLKKKNYKLLNNAVFAKTLENLLNRKNIRSISDVKVFSKLVNKTTFKDRTMFSEDPFLVAVHLRKTKFILDKPIYVGMSVLDISKFLMYNFHYDIMQPWYGDWLKLLYTDTDSFMYQFTMEDFYADMRSPELHDHFNTSDYAHSHPCYSVTNKKVVLGKFKDETNGVPVLEFVGLRPKLY